MRQNIKNLLAAIFLLAIVVRCDIVDQEPSHSLVESLAVQTLDDAEEALIGVYSGLRSTNYYGQNHSLAIDLMGEDIKETNESLGNEQVLLNWIYEPNNADVQGMWARPYTVINRINFTIERVLPLDDGGSGQKNRILAQALGLRALAHFDLLRLFAPDFDRNSSSLGVAIVTRTGIGTPPRSTVSEVYDQIFTDLDDAISLIGDGLDEEINATGAVNRPYLDIHGLNALYARVSLYAGEYADAITYSSAVIGDANRNLATGTDYEDIWTTDAPGDEIIWHIEFDVSDIDIFSVITFGSNNFQYFVPSDDFVALFGATPEDDARYTSFVTETFPGRPDSPFPYHAFKYYRNVSERPNFPVFRVSEMYLIRAEAYAQSDQDALAMDDLNDLREARITGYADENLTGLTLINAIKTERRKELWLEGHRWYDVKRYDESLVRGADCVAPTLFCTLQSTDPAWALPIPTVEMDANTSMVQNTGY